MLSLEEIHNKDLDKQIDIISKADYYDNYLMRLKERFQKINSKEYYLSYSGGKDSHFIYWFIKEYLQDNDIKIVGINTYMEHPEILQRINKNCDKVLFPTMKPFEIKEKYGSPCFSKVQDDFIDRYQRGSRCKSVLQRVYGDGEDGNWTKFKLNKKAKKLLLSGELHRVSPKCCKYLKKEPARLFEEESGLKPILGVRGGESVLRKVKYTSCLNSKGHFTPLWDCTDDIINEIYKRYNIEIPSVYNHILRTGCMGCPYGSWKHDTEKELALLKGNQKKFVCEYFKESYEVLGIKIDEKEDNI